MASFGDGITVNSLGTTLNVSLPDEAFYGEFQAALPAYWKTIETRDASLCLQIVEYESGTRATPTYELRINGVTVAPELNRAAASDLLHEKLNYYLGEFSDKFAFIHAGVVRWQDEVILLPGRSHAGKTTLTAALVRAGADYISDDLAVIGPGATVQLLSQPMRLRADVAGGFDLSACSQPDLLATDHAPIAGIVFLQYCAGQNLRLQTLSKGEATQHLLANSMNARHQPQLVMQYCAAAAQRAWCAQGVRGDAAQAADYILNHVVTALKQAGGSNEQAKTEARINYNDS